MEKKKQYMIMLVPDLQKAFKNYCQDKGFTISGRFAEMIKRELKEANYEQ